MKNRPVRAPRGAPSALASVFAAGLALTAVSASPMGRAQGIAISDAPVLEEVVVTARKREESLRDVPLTVTAVTADAIERLGIRDAYDVSLYTPAFSNVASFGRNSVERPVIRGQANILGDPNASYFVDGVFLSGSTSNTETANLERIEVIKGPQAVLYGRATFAGAINFVTRKPSDTFEGKVSATVGQHDQRDIVAWVSGPVIDDRLSFYAAVSHLEYGGAYDNPLDQRDDLGAERTKAGTLKLRWTPGEDSEVTALVTGQQDDDG
ncbi:MAG: TonB-dependent receptor plug domain-containing protein, partial [Planctomycetota bacterium]